jgi:hypothetical protein
MVRPKINSPADLLRDRGIWQSWIALGPELFLAQRLLFLLGSIVINERQFRR